MFTRYQNEIHTKEIKEIRELSNVLSVLLNE